MALEITYPANPAELWGGGEAGLTRVVGSCFANGVASGVISGATYKVRHIYAWGFTPRQNVTGAAFHVVKTFDSATGTDILTLTCTASDYFDFWYIGLGDGNQ
jgi:hypothetical protein